KNSASVGSGAATRTTRKRARDLLADVIVCSLTLISGKREDIERASLRRVVGQVTHRVDEAERGCGVARVETGGDNRARPSADARKHGDVLLAVRAFVDDGLADDSRPGLELPEHFARARVDRFE